MNTLADLLVINLGARFTKLLVESWLGKGATTTVIGDVVDIFRGRIQSAADQKKAKRELEELGDRMARELLPLFERAEQRGQVNVEAVVLALESTLGGLTSSRFLVERNLDSGAILAELKQKRTLPSQLFEAEDELYERALERSVRQLVEIVSRLPQFEEAFAARSLQHLSRVTTNVDEILAAVRKIEKTVGAEALDKKVQEYEIDYRLAVQRSLDYLEIFGIDLPPEARSQKLSVAYISLNLESRYGGGGESLPAEVLFDRLSSQKGRLLIRGDAGTGKSTLLRWVAIQAAAGNRDTSQSQVRAQGEASTASWRDRVPFLIRLRQCRGGSLPRPEEFPEHVAKTLDNPPTEWVKSLLKSGRALLLLDGVDEIPNAHRETTRRGITDLVAAYPKTDFIISTRPRAVDPDWLGNLSFQEARINPLSNHDRARFVDRWHDAVAKELQERGKDSADLNNLSNSLKKELDDNPEVARLATNPLLCAMICALHRDRRQKLPERQRQLCEDLCHALLHRRERESGLNLDDFPEPYRRLDYPQKRAAVQELAHHMVLNGYSSVPTEEAETQIGKALKQFPGHSAADASVVTDQLIERSGILREETPREISFLHNTLKELLAGDYFASTDAAGLLANHALDPAWQPVILFAVATNSSREFATKVIRKILPGLVFRGNIRARQLMALRCRAAALYVEEDLDLRLQQLSTTLFPPRNMEDAEAFAAGGNTVVPLLTSSERLTGDEAAASIRALRLIGTSQAREALQSYIHDCRETVVSELAQAINPLKITWIQERLSDFTKIPDGIRRQIADLSPLIEIEVPHTLDLRFTQVVDLSPLAELKELQILNVAHTQISDVSSLSGLKKLQELDFSYSNVADLSPLAELKSLRQLAFSGTQVANLTPLSGLNALQDLSFAGTEVEDFSVLPVLNKLKILNLGGTRLTDLSSLTSLKKLNKLSLAGTQVTNFSPLPEFEQLSNLNLSGSHIVDLSPLVELKNLRTLDLSSTQVSDFSILSDLKQLRRLNLSKTSIADLRQIQHMQDIFILNVNETKVKDLRPLTQCCKLQFLDLAKTPVVNLWPLVQCEELWSLDLRNTPATDLSPLAQCKKLHTVTLGKNQEVDISHLKGLKNLKIHRI